MPLETLGHKKQPSLIIYQDTSGSWICTVCIWEAMFVDHARCLFSQVQPSVSGSYWRGKAAGSHQVWHFVVLWTSHTQCWVCEYIAVHSRNLLFNFNKNCCKMNMMWLFILKDPPQFLPIGLLWYIVMSSPCQVGGWRGLQGLWIC